MPIAQSAKEELARYCGAPDPRPIVVYATDRYVPARGGVQTYVERLIDCLTDHFRFVVLTATRDAARLDEAILRPESPIAERCESGSNAPLVVSARLGAANAAVYRRRREEEELANAEELAAYHTNRWQTMRLLATLLADELGVIRSSRVIVHAMGPWEMSLAAVRIFPGARRIVTPFIHPGHWGDDPYSVRWFAGADRIVSLTPADQAVCASVGLPTDRTTTVPVPYGRQLRTRLPGPRNVVAFVGVNRPYKGADLFVAAARLVAPSWPSVSFVLLTSPPQDSTTEVAAAADGPVQSVMSPSDRERDDYLERAVCLVLPSETEISPYVILEAWDHGALAIVSDDAHFRSFIGEGGICVSRDVRTLAGAMSDVLAGAIDTRRMVEAGRTRLDTVHAPASVAVAMSAVYQGRLMELGRDVKGCWID